MNISNKMETLSIKGFKCLSDHQVKLGKLTLLAGGNSVGKSSTIQALLLLRSTYERLKRNYPSIKNDTEYPPVLQIPLNGDYFLNLGDSSRVVSPDSQSIEIKIEGIEIVKAIYDVEDTKQELVIHYKSGSSISGKSHPILNDEFFQYLYAERIGLSLVYERTVQDFEDVGIQGEHTIHILADERSESNYIDETKLFKAEPIKKRIPQVVAWLNYIIPNTELKPERIDQINKALVSYNGKTPYNVGFGLSYVLPIIVAGLIAPKGSMLIVENPEAHLHPSGQSRIGRFLARIAASGVQVIIETHSEHVMNGARIQSLEEEELSPKEIAINYFAKENDKVDITLIELDQEGDLNEFPRGFFDQNEEDLQVIIEKKIQKIKS